jgi:hypothetical protein
MGMEIQRSSGADVSQIRSEKEWHTYVRPGRPRTIASLPNTAAGVGRVRGRVTGGERGSSCPFAVSDAATCALSETSFGKRRASSTMRTVSSSSPRSRVPARAWHTCALQRPHRAFGTPAPVRGPRGRVTCCVGRCIRSRRCGALDSPWRGGISMDMDGEGFVCVYGQKVRVVCSSYALGLSC